METTELKPIAIGTRIFYFEELKPDNILEDIVTGVIVLNDMVQYIFSKRNTPSPMYVVDECHDAIRVKADNIKEFQKQQAKIHKKLNEYAAEFKSKYTSDFGVAEAINIMKTANIDMPQANVPQPEEI